MVLSDELYYRRLAVELQRMKHNEPTFHCPNGDTRVYRGVLIGTREYEGGFFKVEMRLSREFPFNPPQVTWYTRIWHPNISDPSLHVCESILTKDWTPALNVFSIVEALRNLLANPNPSSPLNPLAAEQFDHDRRRYERTISEYIRNYARPEDNFWK